MSQYIIINRKMSFERVQTNDSGVPDKVTDIESKPVQKTLVRSLLVSLTFTCPVESSLRREEGRLLLRAVRLWSLQQQWLRHDCGGS